MRDYLQAMHPAYQSEHSIHWADYIYGNGHKIAKVSSTSTRVHLSGTNNPSADTGRWEVSILPVPSNIVISAGDVLHFRMFANNATPTISMGFTDGSNSDWFCGVCYAPIGNTGGQWVPVGISMGGDVTNPGPMAGKTKGLSFEHAMREPGQSVADAQAKYNDFVKTNEDTANNLQIYMSDPDTEFTTLTEALEAFGRALHAIEDSLSPAHAGFQVWDYNPIHIAEHHFNENSINAQEMQNAVNAARSAFNSTFSFFNFNVPLDNSSVTTTQGSSQPCGGNTGVPCGK